MTDTSQIPASPEQARRGRRMATLLFVIGFGPMIFATVMFYTGWFNPATSTNKGQLVSPLQPVQVLGLQGADEQPLENRFGLDHPDPRWHLIIAAETCDSQCEQLLYLARQVNIALGKNADRVRRVAYIGELPEPLAARWEQEYPGLERLRVQDTRQPQWPAGADPAAEAQILVVDPMGNVMMRYGPQHTGKDMLTDLKHLLKLSQVG